MSQSNPETVCPFTTAKVNHDPVMSASNPDVMSSIAHMLEGSTTAAGPNQLDDGYLLVWVSVGLLITMVAIGDNTINQGFLYNNQTQYNKMGK